MKRLWSKTVKRWIGAEACFLALVLSAGCTAADAGVSGYTDAKKGVVVVSEYVALDGEEAGIAHGSGFFIGEDGENPQYLVTNYHVIADYLYFGAGQNAVYEDGQGNTAAVKSYVRVYYESDDYEEAYVVGYDEVADVAVLRLDKPTDKRLALPLLSPADDIVGAKVYAIGFPGVADNKAVDAVTKWGADDVTFTSGIVSRLTTTSGTGVQSIQIDVEIGHGNSGGPLVTEEGRVIGINTWGYTNNEAEEAAYAVNIGEVVKLLKLHSVPYTMGDGSLKGNGKILPFAVGGAVLVLAVLVIAIVLVARGKKSAPSQPAGASAARQPQAASVPLAAPAQASAPASAPVPAPALAPSAPAAQDSGYRLQGVSGALAGRRFMVRLDGPLVLGRSPKECNVTFPADTAGVSGRHCEVWCEEGRIYMKDLGSSHGTYLATGARLSAGQPMELRPGESFWLGSQNETMVVAQKGGNSYV